MEDSYFTISKLPTKLINTVWYWDKHRHIDQWNKIENPEINPHIYDQSDFNEGAKTTQWEKNNVLNKWFYFSPRPLIVMLLAWNA